MARYDHLPIWKDAVRRFPRYHKYALGSDLRRQAGVIESVSRLWHRLG
jgi:hypothetical protein